MNYRRRFIQLAAPLERVTEEVMLASFVRGLEPGIKNELRVSRHASLEEAMELATRLEVKNKELRSGRSVNGPKEIINSSQTNVTRIVERGRDRNSPFLNI